MPARQGTLTSVDGRRTDAEDRIGIDSVGDPTDSVGVDRLHGDLGVGEGGGAGRQKRTDDGAVFRGQRLLHLSWARRRVGKVMRRMRWNRSSGQELRPEHVGMRLHRKFRHLLVEVGDGVMGVMEWQPVARRKAAFWTRWRRRKDEGEAFGAQIGAP